LKKKRQRSVLIKTNPDGTIKERYRVLVEDGFDPRADYIEIDHPKDKVLAGRPIHEVMYDHKAKRMVEKPKINIVLNKPVIECDGKDEVEIRLIGVPDHMEKVQLKVGNNVHEVNPKEPVYINTTSPQQITVNVVDKTLNSRPVYFRGEKKRMRL